MSQSKRFGTLKSVHRRDWIVESTRTFGWMTVRQLYRKWTGKAHGSPNFTIVTEQTIARDVQRLVHDKRLAKRMSPEAGHEYGGGRRVHYPEYRVAGLYD